MEKLVDVTRRNATVSPARANIISLVWGIPLALFAIYLFQLFWGYDSIQALYQKAGKSALVAIAIFLAGILLHEIIHLAAWSLLGRLSIRDIQMGFNVKALMPYAHVRRPLPLKTYRWGAALPGLLLGVLPLLVGIVGGDGGWFVFGLAFSLAALGDAIILWLLRKEDPRVWVEDHPTDPGCVILEGQNQANLADRP